MPAGRQRHVKLRTLRGHWGDEIAQEIPSVVNFAWDYFVCTRKKAGDNSLPPPPTPP